MCRLPRLAAFVPHHPPNRPLWTTTPRVLGSLRPRSAVKSSARRPACDMLPLDDPPVMESGTDAFGHQRQINIPAERLRTKLDLLDRQESSQLSQVVRRDKAPFLSGCESRPATVAPAGNSRSG